MLVFPGLATSLVAEAQHVCGDGSTHSLLQGWLTGPAAACFGAEHLRALKKS